MGHYDKVQLLNKLKIVRLLRCSKSVLYFFPDRPRVVAKPQTPLDDDPACDHNDEGLELCLATWRKQRRRMLMTSCRRLLRPACRSCRKCWIKRRITCRMKWKLRWKEQRAISWRSVSHCWLLFYAPTRNFVLENLSKKPTFDLISYCFLVEVKQQTVIGADTAEH